MLAFSESSLDYNAYHNDNGFTVGICGVIPYYWKDYLDSVNVKVNSLKACHAIYQKLLEEHKTKEKALKKYKGIESKKKEWIVKKILKVTKQIKSDIKKYEHWN